MKKLSVILIVAGGLMYCSPGKADITSVQFQDDGDGAVSCPLYTWDGTPNPDVSVPVDGIENRGGAAQILGTITTDSATTDPTLTLNNTINNSSGFAWTAYEVNVYMNTSFTLSGASVSTPGDWTVSIVQAFPFVSTYGTYKGQIELTGGTPVAVNDSLAFGYTLTFGGDTSFNFTQEMIPVPEPGTFGFLAAGVLLLGGFLAAGRRKSHS